MKTNKSIDKRLKITKTGKVLARQSGKNHFNAKERRVKQINGKRWVPIVIKRKLLSRNVFVPKLAFLATGL